MIPAMDLLEKYGFSEQISGCQGGRGDEQVEPRGFVGQLNTLYDTIMTLTQHYSFVQILRMYNTKTLGDCDVLMQVHQL